MLPTLLDYQTPPQSHKPLRWSALLLSAWSIFDGVFGILVIYGTNVGGKWKYPSDRDIPIKLILFVIGSLVVLWAGRLISLSFNLWKNKPNSLNAAIRYAVVAEIFTYLGWIGLFLIFFMRDKAWNNSENLRDYALGFSIFILLPISTTVTRILLQYARRKEFRLNE